MSIPDYNIEVFGSAGYLHMINQTEFWETLGGGSGTTASFGIRWGEIELLTQWNLHGMGQRHTGLIVPSPQPITDIGDGIILGCQYRF